MCRSSLQHLDFLSFVLKVYLLSISRHALQWMEQKIIAAVRDRGIETVKIVHFWDKRPDSLKGKCVRLAVSILIWCFGTLSPPKRLLYPVSPFLVLIFILFSPNSVGDGLFNCRRRGWYWKRPNVGPPENLYPHFLQKCGESWTLVWHLGHVSIWKPSFLG